MRESPSSMDPLITIDSASPSRRDELDSLRERLRIGRPTGERILPGEIRLVLRDDHIEIRDETSRRRGSRVDFSGIDTRTGTGNVSRNQPLGRAVGDRSSRRSGIFHSVIDATAGFGHDAFMLACMGHRVTAVECDPVIHHLLESSIGHARTDSRLSDAMGDRLESIHADSVEILSRIDPVDIVYLDPMFEKVNRGSALPRKRAQLLRLLAGPPRDTLELFEAARACATKRVVVKRASGDPPLVPDPDHHVAGKIARYDVYLVKPV